MVPSPIEWNGAKNGNHSRFCLVRGMGWNEYGSSHLLYRTGEVALPPAFAYVYISTITHLHLQQHLILLKSSNNNSN
jgi:DNA topoisomerase IB